ncbi:hypothetical protein Droror1_Dr00024003 [Drosera rotundifolia]
MEQLKDEVGFFFGAREIGMHLYLLEMTASSLSLEPRLEVLYAIQCRFNPYIDDCYEMISHLSTWTSQFRVVRDPSAWPTYDGPIIMPRPERKRKTKRG